MKSRVASLQAEIKTLLELSRAYKAENNNSTSVDDAQQKTSESDDDSRPTTQETPTESSNFNANKTNGLHASSQKISAQSQAEPAPLPAAKTSVVSTSIESPWEQNSRQDPVDPLWWSWLRNYFTSGNTLVRVGIVILFFGLAFLAKYASERGIIPIELRMIGIAICGLGMLFIGWRLRLKNEVYALAMQGGGIGVVYLTIFAALRLYQLFPPGLAFAFLLLVCVLSVTLAVLQNSQALAVMAWSGGFIAPVLTSTGGGSHVMLFSYYALLNAGIIGIAWYKSWRPLNLVGFVFTFVIGSAWGFKNYSPELFWSTEPFLILFFVFYVTISVLYAIRQPINLRGYIDGTLVFGTPIIVFSLQYLLVRNMEHGLVYSAIALFTFYVLLAYGLFKYVANYDKNDHKAYLPIFPGGWRGVWYGRDPTCVR